jgi:hypothetical protein
MAALESSNHCVKDTFPLYSGPETAFSRSCTCSSSSCLHQAPSSLLFYTAIPIRTLPSSSKHSTNTLQRNAYPNHTPQWTNTHHLLQLHRRPLLLPPTHSLVLKQRCPRRRRLSLSPNHSRHFPRSKLLFLGPAELRVVRSPTCISQQLGSRL